MTLLETRVLKILKQTGVQCIKTGSEAIVRTTNVKETVYIYKKEPGWFL
jgi:hypothetical protein